MTMSETGGQLPDSDFRELEFPKNNGLLTYLMYLIASSGLFYVYFLFFVELSEDPISNKVIKRAPVFSILMLSYAAYLYYGKRLVTKIYVGKKGIELSPAGFQLGFDDIEALVTREVGFGGLIEFHSKEKNTQFIPCNLLWRNHYVRLNLDGTDKKVLHSIIKQYLNSGR